MLTVLLPPEQYRIGFEEPGYDAVRDIFVSRGYSFTPLPVHEDGISLQPLRESSCNLVYITPSHQYPLGHITPIANRHHIISAIRERGGYIIEDDYDSEFRYGSSITFPVLQSLDSDGRVFYTGVIVFDYMGGIYGSPGRFSSALPQELREELILYFHGASEGKTYDLLKENGKVGFAIYKDNGVQILETVCRSKSVPNDYSPSGRYAHG